MKVKLTKADLKVLAEHAKTRGTQDAWIDLALEWMDYAADRIDVLEGELLEVNNE